MRLLFRLGADAHAVDVAREADGRWRVLSGERELRLALGGRTEAGGASTFTLEVDGRRERAVVARDGRRWWVALGGEVVAFEEVEDGGGAATPGHGPWEVVTPMPGRVVKVLVAVGDRVEAGQTVATIEAMKMETALAAARPGRVASVLVSAGDRVEPGQRVVAIEDDSPGR
jgi:biotin carboxyl carrier protein